VRVIEATGTGDNDETARGAKAPTRDETRWMAVNFTRLPEPREKAGSG
jgi:hypothetical protein